ncbi:MAG TPA: M48 family metalloprotease [Vicinamibacterales bacterium]|nr:M48 family metalloprotease [Vicinamibacterales bacterium]
MKSPLPVSLIVVAVAVAAAETVRAQIPSQLIQRGGSIAKGVMDAPVNEQEEQQIGADVSARLREKYGVVQDAAVHKYVTLVGRTLAGGSARPALKWTFIVLDTDGINAFAAPGGYVHITRGALALIKSEGELADVLAHEIAHVTEKHTIDAIRNSKIAGIVADNVTRSQFIQELGKKAYDNVLENKYDRKQEIGADRVGVSLANGAGYAPTGLGAFLTRLAERNAGLKEPSGIFASHPDTQARLAELTKVIARDKLTATAQVAARYAKSITYKPVPIAQVAQVAPPPAEAPKKEEPKKGGSGTFGIQGLPGLGGQKSSDGTIAAAGARGVNPDRDAKGGPNKALVVVNVTAAELAEFKKGIQ